MLGLGGDGFTSGDERLAAVNLAVGAGARGALTCERDGLDGMSDREVLSGEKVAQRGGGPERRGPRRELDGAGVVSCLRGRRGSKVVSSAAYQAS